MSLSLSETRTVVAGAMIALFLAALDQTIVATALPSIAADLGGFTLMSWVVTAYLLTSVCVTPIFGKLSDVYGRRRMLTICLLIFLAGSMLCAIATGMIGLIAARAMQGLGGGGLVTLSQIIVGDVVPPRERGRYAAWFAGTWAAASLLGPFLGGVLAERAGWPWIFLINLPIGLAALLICDRSLRKLPFRPRPARVDFPGIGLLSAATVALLLVLSLGGKPLSWTGTPILALAAAATILGVLFAWRQRRAADPILAPALIVNPVVGPVLATIFLVFGGYLAVAVLVPVYFQVALGTSAARAGALLIPLTLSSAVTAFIGGRHSQITGRYKVAPLVGLPVSVLALAVLAAAATRISAEGAAVLLLIMGLGLGPIFPCALVAAQNAASPRDLGAVSGAIGFARALGGAMAVAAGSALVLGMVAASGTVLTGGLEDLVRPDLPADIRGLVASAFSLLFAATAGVLGLAFLIYWTVEDRELRGRGVGQEVIVE